MWTRLTSWFRSQPHLPPTLLAPRDFHTRLEQERMRADRSGKSLALVTVTPHGEANSEPGRRRLAAMLKVRLRATDVAGLLDDARIGVALPETTSKGAWKLADDLERLFADDRSRLECSVALYPSESPRGSDHGDACSSIRVPAPGPRAVEPLEVMFLRRTPLLKRTIDVVGAAVGLVVLSPLLLATAAAVKLSSPGPVFFRQRRDGLGGRPFVMCKFRTMYVDAEARKAALRKYSEQDGPAFKMKNDPRIMPLGRFLRKTCIDELPQLWNVLKGDMSLVGPRPLPCDESNQCRGWERRRLEVTPGLTCIWQVDGGSKVTFAEWMRMDIRYIGRRSFFSDMRLILRTCVTVLFARGSQ